jgi:hypothetical protein
LGQVQQGATRTVHAVFVRVVAANRKGVTAAAAQWVVVGEMDRPAAAQQRHGCRMQEAGGTSSSHKTTP